MCSLHQRLTLCVTCFVFVFMGQDRHIEELTTLLGHYRKVKDVAVLTQGNNRRDPVSAALMGLFWITLE